MRQYNILVSSIGGDLGQAVCKALRYSRYDIKILGTDCKDFVPFPIFCDSFQVVPKADDTVYKDFISKLVIERAIDMIYICSEQELFFICDHIEEFTPQFTSRIAIPPLPVINICRDKYKTMEFLKVNGFPYPSSTKCHKSIPVEVLLKDLNYPFVIKKTSDCGSKHLHIITNTKDLEGINCIDDTYMLQEYISGIEYTNGVFRDLFTNEVYVITLERTLKNGMSDEAKVIHDKEIEKLCVEVSQRLNLTGAINIQLRRKQGGVPVIFEINPRYSSTAYMRAKFGFNDVIYAFENIVLKKNVTSPHIITGEAYRYTTEYYRFY